MRRTGVLLHLWAKKKIADDGKEIRYPLLFHMLDTLAVAQELWDRSLQAGTRRFLAQRLGIPENEARSLISFWAGLHDIGKASPGFQGKSEIVWQSLEDEGLIVSGKDPGHATITACLLQDFLQNVLSKELARKIAMTLGGHHGIFPRSEDIQDVGPNAGNPKWREVQQGLFDKMAQLRDIKPKPLGPNDPGPPFFMFLAGFTSVADWIASNDAYFPYEVKHGVEDHLDYSQHQACKALDQLGWTGWQPPSAAAQIRDLFPSITETRPLQDTAIRLAQTLKDRPGLVIIEAPMGEGKTEAAILLADSWATGLGQKGCYFALPTMATSDQMFGRVKSYLNKRYHDERVNLMLLHGHAALSAEFEGLKKQFGEFSAKGVSGDKGYDGAPAGVVASEWFTYRKRGLLAPFGVGTVDQVLLAVLQTRHVFVRLFGLANKTVIIDEIHAYDAYMTTLLERLLEWLAALGSSVIMLSATLPRGRRDALLKAYVKGLSKKDTSIPTEVSETKYPRISWTDGTEFKAETFQTSSQSVKELQLRWVDSTLPDDSSEFCLGKALQEALSGGGCAAVICNTVDQAQRVYMALKPYFPSQDAGDGYPELDLLHARYLFGDRRRREERTLLRFGKPEGKVQCEDGIERSVQRPDRSVLVATQIVEQSLDIDFDLMVTEMAPVDLLLQRSGRLHRHQRERRPERLKLPRLWIGCPEIRDGVPDFGSGTEAVYDPHMLLRSWLAIRDREAMKIPDEVEKLIEEVYHERECPAELPEEITKKWEESLTKLEEKRGHYENTARQNRILSPLRDTESLLEAFNKRLEEDDPTVHRTLQALTRYSEMPTVSVLCLYGTPEEPYLDKGFREAIDPHLKPDLMNCRKLLSRSLPVSNRYLVNRMLPEKDAYLIPAAWREVAQLRHHFLLLFDEINICEHYGVSLDDELGLVIPKTWEEDSRRQADVRI